MFLAQRFYLNTKHLRDWGANSRSSSPLRAVCPAVSTSRLHSCRQDTQTSRSYFTNTRGHELQWQVRLPVHVWTEHRQFSTNSADSLLTSCPKLASLAGYMHFIQLVVAFCHTLRFLQPAHRGASFILQKANTLTFTWATWARLLPLLATTLTLYAHLLLVRWDKDPPWKPRDALLPRDTPLLSSPSASLPSGPPEPVDAAVNPGYWCLVVVLYSSLCCWYPAKSAGAKAPRVTYVTTSDPPASLFGPPTLPLKGKNIYNNVYPIVFVIS